MTPEERKLVLCSLYEFIRSPEFILILEQVMHSVYSDVYDNELLDEALHEFQTLAEEQVYAK